MANKKRKQGGTEGDGGALLQMMTISLFIILLAFFILLNSIAVTNEVKIQSAIGSLLGSFGGPRGGYSVIEGMGEKMDSLTLKTERGHLDLSTLLIGNEELIQHIRVRPNKRGSVIQISSLALFNPDGFELNSAGTLLLSKLATFLGKEEFPIEISGHTDNMPAAEPQTTTKREMTALQALGVMKYFVEKERIPTQRITAYGWGDTHPAYSNKTAEARDLNRRIELLLVHRPSKKVPKGGFMFRGFFFQTVE